MMGAVRETRRRRHRAAGFIGRFFAFAIEAVLCIGILGVATYAFYSFAGNSDYFRVKWLQIEGTKVLSEDVIREHCGVTDTSNILFLSQREIRRRVEAIPYVRECRVTSVFPDTVVIRITEREAVATVLSDNRLLAVDREGRILSELGLADEQPGPLITNLPIEGALELGQIIDHPALREALSVWQAFVQTRVAREVSLSEISAQQENDIRMYCDGIPFELRWGRGDYERQAKRLDVLWKAKNGRPGCETFLDLRFGRDLICQ